MRCSPRDNFCTPNLVRYAHFVFYSARNHNYNLTYLSLLLRSKLELENRECEDEADMETSFHVHISPLSKTVHEVEWMWTGAEWMWSSGAEFMWRIRMSKWCRVHVENERAECMWTISEEDKVVTFFGQNQNSNVCNDDNVET